MHYPKTRDHEVVRNAFGWNHHMEIFGETTFQSWRTDDKWGPLTKISGVKKTNLNFGDIFQKTKNMEALKTSKVRAPCFYFVKFHPKTWDLFFFNAAFGIFSGFVVL